MPRTSPTQFSDLSSAEALTPTAIESLAQQAVSAFWEHHRRTGELLLEAIAPLANIASLDQPTLAQIGNDALFGALVERLSDSFRHDYCILYDQVFAQVIQACRRLPGFQNLDVELSTFGLYHAEALCKRKIRLNQRQVRLAGSQLKEIRKAVVLSRVTLGADVAITSIILSRLQSALPGAGIVFLAPQSSQAVVAGNRQISFRRITYERREGLRARLNSWLAVLEAVREEIAELAPSQYIVADPDTRLTQLGLLPLVDDSRYLFFPSRSYCRPGLSKLCELTASWLAELLCTEGQVLPSIWLTEEDDLWGRELCRRLKGAGGGRIVSVSWGVGGDERKRIGDDFEYQVVHALASDGHTVLLSRGVGPEETRQTRALARRLAETGLKVLHLDTGRGLDQLDEKQHDVITWEADVGAFCASIAHSDQYVGYDSAGQHIAAALGVPTITVFVISGGATHLERWTPHGPGPVRVVTVEDGCVEHDATLDRVMAHHRELRDRR